MKTYFKLLSVLAITILFSSFLNIELMGSEKIIFTKMNVNKKAKFHETITIFENGTVSIDKRVEGQSQTPRIENLSKNQLFKLKKLLNNSSIKYADKSYTCNKKDNSKQNYQLYIINTPSVKKKIFAQKDCKIPKSLKDLDNYILELTID